MPCKCDSGELSWGKQQPQVSAAQTLEKLQRVGRKGLGGVRGGQDPGEKTRVGLGLPAQWVACSRAADRALNVFSIWGTEMLHKSYKYIRRCPLSTADHASGQPSR